jgi:hypothetical protein
MIWKNVNFENYPNLVKLLHAMRDRPEFAENNVLPKERPLHEHFAKHAQEPPGVKVQLYLPWNNE